MTAAQRLAQLSGLSTGTAAQHLRSLALAGGLAGALLVGYSGLPSGTASQHLLADRSTSQVITTIRIEGELRNWLAASERLWTFAPVARNWTPTTATRSWRANPLSLWQAHADLRSWAATTYPIVWDIRKGSERGM